MKGISFQQRPENRVTAFFEAGVFSIDISGATTFGDLAARLADLGKQHGETLAAVQLTKTSRSTPASHAIGPDAARAAEEHSDLDQRGAPDSGLFGA